MEPDDGSRRLRSPAYPSSSLTEVVEDLRSLWRIEGRNETLQQVAVAALGYRGLSGAAKQALATLRQFGLIDRREGGRVRVSDLGTRLMSFTADSPEYARALEEALRQPELFRFLLDSYPERLPSDQTLAAELILTRGFAPDTATKAVRVFRESVAVLPPVNEAEQVQEMSDPASASLITAAPGRQRRFVWSLSNGATVQVETFGDITAAEAPELKVFFDLIASQLASAPLANP